MTDRLPAPSFRGDPPVAACPDVLPDRRELGIVAVERTRMPMIIADARKHDTPIVLANRAFLDLTGYAADEVLGRNCRFLQGPETERADVEAIRRGLAGKDEDVTVELLNYRKDGTTFLNELCISPVHDERGELIYYFASQKDVTARRRAEALEAVERHLLMEVDHRAMNALAIVKSIVTLSRTDTVERYAASVQARVDAIARAHRLLAKSRWTEVDLAALIEGEVPTGFAGRVDAVGPPASVRASVVQPIALVLHEMMSNAVEHGALTRVDGKLTIRWTTQPEAVALDWRERGALPPVAPTPGFGLSVVRGVVERQLGGRFDLTWGRGGLAAEITIPSAGSRPGR